MGREIRRVPPNWKHPQEEKWNPYWGKSETRYIPMHDKNYKDAVKEYNEGILLWNQGKHPEQLEHKLTIESGDLYEPDENRPETIESCKRLNNPNYYMPSEGYNYWDYFGNPPKEESYRHYKDEEATWYQVYETVSEGTPVTPPFATQKELVDYLVANGDFWDQRRDKEGKSLMDCRPWDRKIAEKFVYGDGYAPSFIMKDGKMKTGVEGLYGEDK